VTGLLLALLLSACGAASSERTERDPPHVERLRMRISEVRHAAADVRRTIAASQGAPHLPELYLRLGELTSEEARYHYRVAFEREQRSSKNLTVPHVATLKRRAIGIYRQLLERHPDTSLKDRALFNIGHEQRELGRFDEMQKTLRRLADEHPESPLHQEALLILGDHFFDKGELDKAERFYGRIITGPKAAVVGLAHYKQSWVWVNRGNCKKALGHMEQAIATAKAFERERAAAEAEAPGTQGIDVRREALVDSAYCYSRVRKPDDALLWYFERAADRGAYVAALERLARRYGVMDQAKGAVVVGRELLALGAANDDRLEDARMLHAGIRRTKDYSRVDDDVRLIAQTALRQAYRAGLSGEDRQTMLNDFEQMTRDLLTRAHEAASKIGKEAPKRGKRATEEDRLAALETVGRGYEAHLKAFPASPAIADVLSNLADLKSELKDDLGAGRRYLEVGHLQDADAQAASWYDAVVHFQHVLQGKEPRSQLDRTLARAGLRRAADGLLRRGGLPADKEAKVKLAVGLSYYEEGRYRAAIDRLEATAYEFPGREEAKAAIHLVLDSHNLLNDYDGLAAAARRYLADNSPADAALKAEIRPILQAAEQRKLDEVSLEAAGGEGGDLQALEDLALRYKGTSLGERALLNAFLAARAAGDRAQLYKLADQIAKEYPKSEQLAGIYASVAQAALNSFDFERARDFLTRAAELAPQRRSGVLVALGELRESLGDSQGALRTYGLALAAAKSAEAREGPSSLAAALAERLGDARRTRDLLAPMAGDANPEVLSRLALVQAALGEPDEAEMSAQGVLDSAEGGSPEALGRAHLASAEVLLGVVQTYEPEGDLDSLQELVTLVEVAEQSFLNAARQGSAAVSGAAFSRLSVLASLSSRRLARLPAPPELSAGQQAAIKRGLEARSKQLAQTAEAALAACADLAWKQKVFTPAVRGCIAGRTEDRAGLRLDPISARGATGAAKLSKEDLRKAVRNPDDTEVLTRMGVAFLDAGDPHAARVAFGRAAELGAGPEVTNLLGVAAYEVGDVAGALEAFAQAAEGGIAAASKNLEHALERVGLSAAAAKALEVWPPGDKKGGRLLGGGR